MTIGQRADECIRKKAAESGNTFKRQVELLNTSWETVKNWRSGKGNPTSYFLAEMHRQGYDVIYILTGEPGMNTGGDLCV